MARPTQSYGLYVQQFGRALRLMEGKEWAIIIDHVGNVVRHGLPDMARDWSLARRDKRRSSASDAIPLKACVKCAGVYERVMKACPYCQHVDTPAQRTRVEYVDGDLEELTPAVLAVMRGEIAKMDRTLDQVRIDSSAKCMPDIGIKRDVNLHAKRQIAQTKLRDAISWWGAWQGASGHDYPVIHRTFYHTFNIDIASAQTLGVKEAEELCTRVTEKIPSGQ